MGSNEIKKPKAPPKPLRLTSPNHNKEVLPENKMIIDGQKEKIKPPLLPKPNIKPKPICNGKSPVINNSSVFKNNSAHCKNIEETDSVVHPPQNQTEHVAEKSKDIKEDKIFNVTEQLITNQDETITDTRSINKSSLFQCKKSLNNVKQSPDNINFNSMLEKFESENKCTSVKTKSSSQPKVFSNNKLASELFKNQVLLETQSSLSSPNATKSECNSHTSDLKSIRGNFEISQSINTKMKSNNKLVEEKQQCEISDASLISEGKKNSLNVFNKIKPEDLFDIKNELDSNKNVQSSKPDSIHENIKSCVIKSSTQMISKKSERNEVDASEGKFSKSIVKNEEKVFMEENKKTCHRVESSLSYACEDHVTHESIMHRYKISDKIKSKVDVEQLDETYHSLENRKSNSLEKQLSSMTPFFSSGNIPQTVQSSFLHSNKSKSLNVSSKSVDTEDSIRFNHISPEFLEKVTQEVLSGRIAQKNGQTNMSFLQKKRLSEEIRQNKLSDSHVNINSERWSSTNSLGREGYCSLDSTESISKRVDDNFKDELSNTLKRRSMCQFKEEEHIYDNPICKTTSSDGQDTVAEEPIYWEIDDIVPRKNLADSTNNNDFPKQSSSQTINDTKDEPEKNSPVIVTDRIYEKNSRDLSEDSDSSDAEENIVFVTSTTNQSQTSSSLKVPGYNENEHSNGFSIRQEATNSIRRSISPSKNSKVKRSASDRSTKSRQEDVESIGSSSTENSYSYMRRGISWLSSFGKGEKRLSSFYCDTSPDQSLLDQSDLVSQQIEDPDDSTLAISSEPSSIQDAIPLTPEEIAEKKKRKAFLVAEEIMTSEKKFIDVLVLLSKDMKEQCRSDIPEHEFDSIITPLPQVLLLNEDILKDIEGRIQNWDTLPKISDIFIKKGPFLKLYASYIQNFQTQCNYFDEYCQKYPIFNLKVREFEEKYCKKLSVKHNMLKPIQRIPQYRLLLEQYLEQLEPGSVDYADTERAIQIVCDVADHANKSMKHGDHLCKLLQIQYQLGSYEIIKPCRVFIKEGELFKQTRRGLQQRFFILLSDCFLYTSYSGPPRTGLRVHYELSLNTMTISVPDSDKDYHNEFSIVTTKRSFTLRARSTQERQEWVDALKGAIEAKQKSDMQRLDLTQSLGKIAPVWIPDDNATMCQFCTSKFTTLSRRHHCRACGKVVCAPCSDYKAPLQYKTFKPKRVCQPCYKFLMKEFDDPASNMYDRIKSVFSIEDEQEVAQTMDLIRAEFKGTEAVGPKKQSSVPPRLIEVSAYDAGSQVSGWLVNRSGRNEKSHWYVLKEQVLYRFKAPADIAAEESIAVLGYNVEILNKKENAYIFQLTHQGQDPLIFSLDNEQSFYRWIKGLREATTLR